MVLPHRQHKKWTPPYLDCAQIHLTTPHDYFLLKESEKTLKGDKILIIKMSCLLLASAAPNLMQSHHYLCYQVFQHFLVPRGILGHVTNFLSCLLYETLYLIIPGLQHGQSGLVQQVGVLAKTGLTGIGMVLGTGGDESSHIFR